MLQPKQIEVNGKKFIIHKFPAIEGREIICNYPLTSIPKVSEYKTNQEVMLKLMKYVSVPINDITVALSNSELVNQHAGDWETLMKLEAAVIEYNCSFFQNGLASTFLSGLAQKVPAWITKTLTDSLGQFSLKNKPPSSS
jgi:hypothetical protein